MNIVVTGSIAYDYIMSFPGRFRDHILPEQLDNLSLSFLVDSMKKQRGGTAANIAYNLALLGERPCVMATAGQDFGEYRVWLEQHGVDTSAIKQYDDEFTSSFFVSTDLDQKQIANFYTGAMARASELSFKQLNSAKPDLVIISPNDPQAMKAYALECKALDIPYIYDPSQQIVRLSDEDLRQGIDGSRMLIVNDYEFEMLRGRLHLAESDVLQRTQTLIITRGENGSTIATPTDRVDVPPVLTEHQVDPTGVGDGYRAGLMKGMALGLPWEIAGRMGALAATFVLEHMGPQGHTYTHAEFVQRYRAHFNDSGALDKWE
ncbi:MAG TPA: carbohydrate kinase family protein [Anaerolineae bacterium]|nr:carbohydrate kinase family protein [Anaerolineae bacterium]